jgi:hypothetical protein
MNRIAMLCLLAGGALLEFMTSGQAFAQGAPAPQAQPTPQQRAAALKQQMQASQEKLRAYEWIETTVVTQDGAVSARTQKRCYYGADGRVHKVVLIKRRRSPRR